MNYINAIINICWKGYEKHVHVGLSAFKEIWDVLKAMFYNWWKTVITNEVETNRYFFLELKQYTLPISY